MNDNNTIVNRVAKSDIQTIDPEKYYPGNSLESFDFKDYLFKGLILREKDFRAALKSYDWSQLQGKYLHVQSSTDAVIPLWAYMLVGVYAKPYVRRIFNCSRSEAINHVILEGIQLDYTVEKITDGKFVIKGCSQHNLSPDLYIALSAYLQPHAKSIMFGEPCSTVPIYKRKKISN
jgi:hypothetical protein